jgi:hypothetical protein
LPAARGARARRGYISRDHGGNEQDQVTRRKGKKRLFSGARPGLDDERMALPANSSLLAGRRDAIDLGAFQAPARPSKG